MMMISNDNEMKKIMKKFDCKFCTSFIYFRYYLTLFVVTFNGILELLFFYFIFFYFFKCLKFSKHFSDHTTLLSISYHGSNEQYQLSLIIPLFLEFALLSDFFLSL